MRRWRSAVAASAVLMAALSACGGGSSGSDTAAKVSFDDLPAFQNFASNPLGPATQTVTEDDGTSWSYAHPASGKVTLLYFGYTRCPDICPTTMADIAGALKRLPAAESAKVAVQFVSTDPARDTAPQIKRWLGGFDPDFAGARGPIGQVVDAARTYDVGVSAPKKVHGQIEVTHGAQLLVLDQHGRLVGYFDSLAGPAAYAQALPTLIKAYA